MDDLTFRMANHIHLVKLALWLLMFTEHSCMGVSLCIRPLRLLLKER